MARAGTRRVVMAGALVAAGVAAFWALAVPGRPPTHRAPTDEEEEAAGAASGRRGGAGRDAPRREQKGEHDETEAARESSDAVRARLAREQLEQRTHNDARHVELAARWRDEAGAGPSARPVRDEPWATDQERALQSAASSAGIDHLIFALECRRSVCRVEISAADSDTAFALRRARALIAALGTDTGSAALGAGRDRALEVFAAREGMGGAKGP